MPKDTAKKDADTVQTGEAAPVQEEQELEAAGDDEGFPPELLEEEKDNQNETGTS